MELSEMTEAGFASIAAEVVCGDTATRLEIADMQRALERAYRQQPALFAKHYESFKISERMFKAEMLGYGAYVR